MSRRLPTKKLVTALTKAISLPRSRKSPAGSPTHPLNTLPQEVIICIFEQYIDPSYFINSSTHWHSDTNFLSARVKLGGTSVPHANTPILLSHVCSQWRAVSHSTPTLWGAIRLYHPGRKRDLHLLEFYLKQSGSTLLDIFIKYDLAGPLKSTQDKVVTSIMNKIFPVGARVRRLDLRDVPASLAHSFFPVLDPTPGGIFPNLVSFYLRPQEPNFLPFQSGALGYRLMQHLYTSPALEEVVVFPGFDLAGWTVAIPWPNLQVVHWKASVTIDAFNSFVVLCAHSLVELRVDAVLQVDSRLPAMRTITLPKLLNLSLTIKSNDLPPRFLSAIRLPSLKNVQITHSYPHDDHNTPDISASWDLLVPLLQRSECRLESISIDAYWKDDHGSTARALQQPAVFDHVTTLRVDVATLVATGICSALCTRGDSNQVVLPKLSCLRLCNVVTGALCLQVREEIHRREQENAGLVFVLEVVAERNTGWARRAFGFVPG